MNKVTDLATFKARKTETPDECKVRPDFLELMEIAEAACGIHLERLVHEFEERCIKVALARHPDNIAEAALWLGYRPEALKYVLKRHPSIRA
jgi:transcriptional regulator with GAF, ATPase, and Fis domain